MLNLDSDATANSRDALQKAWVTPLPAGTPAERIIHLKKRKLFMLTQDLILRNPLRLLGHEKEDIILAGQFGAVLARAGVGKTALIVQIALNTMLHRKNVLHISLNEPVGKVNIWYHEVLGRMAQQYEVPNMEQLWDTILPSRFIMTFQVEGFSVPKLEERLTDLMSQDIFHPHMIIIDGQPFDQDVRPLLEALKKLAQKLDLPIWFTITTHRQEEPADSGALPIELAPLEELFDVVIALQPEAETIYIQALKGCSLPETQPPLVFDPATMLIKTQA